MAAKKKKKSKKKASKKVSKKTKKTVTRKVTKKSSRKKSKRRAGGLKLPALSTLVKVPRKSLESGVHRIETALEVKAAPGLHSPKTGRALRIGPKRRPGFKSPERNRNYDLPKEVLDIFN
jgi:hypothetical protein